MSDIAPTLASPSIAPDTSRLATGGNLKAAGEKFEAIFYGLMLKSMRSAKLGDELLSSSAGDRYRDMQDQQLAQSLAANHPLGLGKAVTEFLAKNQPKLNGDAP